MKHVYSPANAPDAHMLSHLLEQAGIKAHIHGEALQGASGELPVVGTLQILVADDDYEQSRRLLLEWERTEPPPEIEADTSRGFPVRLVMIFLALGVAGGWVLKSVVETSRVSIGEDTRSADRNSDGSADSTWFYRPGDTHAYKGEFDHNHDGRTDVRTFYDGIGTPIEEDTDDDFNGTFETKSFFRSGVVVRSEVDTDENNVADDTSFYSDGIVTREEISDSRYGTVVRINYFEGLQLARADIDLDRDGFRETRRVFDRFGEIVRTEAIER